MSNVIPFKRRDAATTECEDSPHETVWQMTADMLDDARDLLDEVPLAPVMPEQTVATLKAAGELAERSLAMIATLLPPAGESTS